MDTKTFIVKILKIISWPTVILILGLSSINLFSFKTAQVIIPNPNLFLKINTDFVTTISTIITALTAIFALILTYKAGIFDKTPNVYASGTFIVSTKDESTNKKRDDEIDQDKSIHTLQLINLGKGIARNIIPSIRKDIEGKFLEDVCPHSYVLPPGESTRDFGEILRVHGQRFVNGKKEETIQIGKEKVQENEVVGYFYIDFEDHSGKPYKTIVKISKVKAIDKSIKGGRLEELRSTTGIEIWKVVDNAKETN